MTESGFKSKRVVKTLQQLCYETVAKQIQLSRPRKWNLPLPKSIKNHLFKRYLYYTSFFDTYLDHPEINHDLGGWDWITRHRTPFEFEQLWKWAKTVQEQNKTCQECVGRGVCGELTIDLDGVEIYQIKYRVLVTSRQGIRLQTHATVIFMMEPITRETLEKMKDDLQQLYNITRTEPETFNLYDLCKELFENEAARRKKYNLSFFCLYGGGWAENIRWEHVHLTDVCLHPQNLHDHQNYHSRYGN